MLKKALCLCCAIVMVLSSSVSAFAADSAVPKIVELPSTRAIDTSFTLDFDESDMWAIDFTNDDSFFNHKELKVKMGSVKPNDSNAIVEVEIRVFDSSVGDYVALAPEYQVNFIPGQIKIWKLPYGATAKDYRIIFWRLSNSISTAEFTVITDETFDEFP